MSSAASPSLATSPSLSLELASRPENLTLVRGMLVGVGELLSLDPELLDDLKTAVSEAANNVVMHAYGGDEGPLAVSMFLDDRTISVSVGDRGSGLVENGGDREERHPGIGMAVIRALAQDVEVRRPPRGGTEVYMSFSGERAGKRLYGTIEAPVEPDGWTERQEGEVKVSVSPVNLLDGVLGRLARVLAAHARFSLDRFSDVYLVTDALAILADRAAATQRIGFCLAADPRLLLITLGPLRPGTHELLSGEDPSLGAHSPLSLLSDSMDVDSEPEGGERLRVLLSDGR